MKKLFIDVGLESYDRFVEVRRFLSMRCVISFVMKLVIGFIIYW